MNWLTERISNTVPWTPRLIESIPKRYQLAGIAGIGQQDCKKLAIDYINQFYEVAVKGIGVLLLGKSGTWKTYTCAAILNISVQAPLDVLFVSCAVDLPIIARNMFEESGQHRLDKIKTTTLVVMDDFTMVPAGSRQHELLNEIAEARFGNQLPTLWTGNLGSQGIKEAMTEMASLYGPGFARRVYHGSENFRLRVV